MKSTLYLATMIVFLLSFSMSVQANDKVKIDTSLGEIVIELDGQKAPETVKNFLGYVNSGFYDGTIFHRVIPRFMIQGGGFTEGMVEKKNGPAIKNEADNALKNTRGAVAMARTNDPDSATSQFFINTVDNAFLDFRSKSQEGWGYCVFGKVISGMDVIDKIEKVQTGNRSMYQDVPLEPVVIKKATVIKPEKPAAPKVN